MISLTPNTAIILYLGATLVFLLGTWILFHFTSKRKTGIAPTQQLYICEYCQYVYLDDRMKPVTQCPQCQTLNKENPYSSRV